MGKPTELLQGTLDLLILKTLALQREAKSAADARRTPRRFASVSRR